MASTQAVGWEHIHGVITAGRLEDFFDYSAPFHIVAFNLKGATTVEWKRGTRFTRFQAQPGELLITPSGEGNSIRQHQPNEAFSCCLSPDRLQSLAEQEWNSHGQTIEIVAGYNRDAELWSTGPAAGRAAPLTDPWLAPLRRDPRHPDRDQALVELFVPAAPEPTRRRRSWPIPGSAG